MLDRLTAADFDPLCGSAFALEVAPGRVVAADLVSVTALGVPPARTGEPPRRRGFSLVFRAKGPDRWPQGIYPLAHDRLGRLDVFFVPIGRDDEGLLLEAVFN